MRMFMDKELFLPLAFLGVVLLIIVIILVKVLATKIKNTYIRRKYKLSNEQIYGQDKATEKLIALQNSVDELYKKIDKRYEQFLPNLYDVNSLSETNIKLLKIEKSNKYLSSRLDDKTNLEYEKLKRKYAQVDELIKSINPSGNRASKILSDIISDADYVKQIILLKNKISFLESAQSNLTAIPYMTKIVADYETYGLEHLAKELDWGYNQQRMKKVKSIRDIRHDAKAMVEKNKEALYQLSYLLNLFPSLQDVIETDYNDLPIIDVNELPDYDPTRDYLSKEEYNSLSTVERNQLALDRYKASHKKSKWQIGRDYELYIGYRYSQSGYSVDYFGSYMGLEDLGRDLICKKGNKVLIVQCKYWSSKKEIHEKHITQLYGTMASYCIEHNCPKDDVKGVLITNIQLSPMAKKMAKYLGIKFRENIEVDDYPCIKCNIGRDMYGETKIYHLPFDQQYDSTKISKKGEFYAMTVAEAEEAGFRRAFKWFGN